MQRSTAVESMPVARRPMRLAKGITLTGDQRDAKIQEHAIYSNLLSMQFDQRVESSPSNAQGTPRGPQQGCVCTHRSSSTFWSAPPGAGCAAGPWTARYWDPSASHWQGTIRAGSALTNTHTQYLNHTAFSVYLHFFFSHRGHQHGQVLPGKWMKTTDRLNGVRLDGYTHTHTRLFGWLTLGFWPVQSYPRHP